MFTSQIKPVLPLVSRLFASVSVRVIRLEGKSILYFHVRKEDSLLVYTQVLPQSNLPAALFAKIMQNSPDLHFRFPYDIDEGETNCRAE